MGFGKVVLHFTHDETWRGGTNFATDREGEVQEGLDRQRRLVMTDSSSVTVAEGVRARRPCGEK